jgi:hypothetical protein
MATATGKFWWAENSVTERITGRGFSDGGRWDWNALLGAAQ